MAGLLDIESLLTPERLQEMRDAARQAPAPYRPMLDTPVDLRDGRLPDDTAMAGRTLRPNVPAFMPTINPEWHQPWNPQFQNPTGLDLNDNAGAAAHLLSRYRWR